MLANGRIRQSLIALVTHVFHTQLWFPDSDYDFQQFESDFRSLHEFITGKNVVEEIESIIGEEWNSPLYSTEITH